MAHVRQVGPSGSYGAADDATDKGQQAKDAAQHMAQDASAQARSRLRDQADERSTQLGRQVKTGAQDVRAVGDQLRQQGKDKPAQLVDQLAERGERLGGYLEESGAERILSDAEDFGRRRPWAMMLGGLALGLAASRLLKASSRQRYESRMTQPDARPRNTQVGTPATDPPEGRTIGAPPPAYAPSGRFADEHARPA
jgi:hypothetical protein